jgi:hypothetical protein
MNEQPDHDALIQAEAARMLRRIGWGPGDVEQARIAARLPPARKVEGMLKLRDEFVRLLRKRLQAEHPEDTPEELARRLRAHLDLVEERYPYG